MKKSLKPLIVSLLSANLIVGSMATVVMAEEGGSDQPAETTEEANGETEPPVNSGETEVPGESENPEEPEEPGNSENPEESEPPHVPEEEGSGEEGSDDESDEEDSEEGTEGEESDGGETTPPTPTYPVEPPSSYVPPRTVPRTQVPTSSDETETSIASQFGIDSNIENIETLLTSSLEDPNFVLAWEDYRTLVTDFELNDISSESAQIGSTFEEILASFEGNTVPEQTTTDDGQNVLVFNYSEEETEEATPVQIILVGDESGNLIGSTLLQASTAQTSSTPVNASTIQGLVDQEIAGLYGQELYVTALYQVLSNDVTYTTLATPSETEGANEFITLDNQFVLSHTTGEQADISLLNQLQESVASYIEGLENQEVEEVSEELTEETTEETTEEGEPEVIEEEDTTNQFVERFAPSNYEELPLLSSETVTTGYEELTEMIDGFTLTLTADQLTEIFGEPSREQVAGNSTYYDYYSVEDDNIVLLNIQVDTNSNVVTTMKYDVRTPKLDEEFDITVDELFELAASELTMDNLTNSLGNANIIEHIFAGGHQIRHVWTSYTDSEMRNVEAYEDTETGNVELYYYDQD